MSEEESGISRREVLGLMAAGGVASASWEAIDKGLTDSSGLDSGNQRNYQQIDADITYLNETAEITPGPDSGQFMGDMQRTGYAGEGISFTGINDQTIRSEDNQPDFFETYPSTHPERPLFAISYNNKVQILDDNGDIVNEVEADGRASNPVMKGDTISFVDSSGGFKAYNIDSRELLGENNINGAGISTLLTEKDQVLAPIQSDMFLYDSSNADFIERFEDLGSIARRTMASVDGENIIYNSGEEDAIIRLNLDSGEVEARYENGASTSGAAMDSNHYFFSGGGAGELLKALDKDDLSQVAEYEFPGTDSTPLLRTGDNNTEVFIGDDSGMIRGLEFDPSSGSFTENWVYDTGDVRVQDYVGLGQSLIASTENNVLGIHMGTGEEIFDMESDLGEAVGGRLGMPFDNKIPMKDYEGGSRLLEFEKGHFEEGGVPEPVAAWQGIPEDNVPIGETAEFDFVVRNEGDGSIDGNIRYLINPEAEDPREEFVGMETLEPDGQISQSWNLTPRKSDENYSFESEDGIQVQLPVQLQDDGENEVELTGIFSTDSENGATKF